MTEQEKLFEKTIDTTIEQIKKTLIEKGREYRRNNNPFHNFEEGTKRTGKIREKVLDGMLLKHEISIDDMTNDLEQGKLPSIEAVNEKFNDNIIYLLLKKASIVDRIENGSKLRKYMKATGIPKLSVNPDFDIEEHRRELRELMLKTVSRIHKGLTVEVDPDDVYDFWELVKTKEGRNLITVVTKKG